jgi:ribonuclease BN (tRNA processing enzyme)
MKITVLGCGNAFSHCNYNQSFLLEENNRTMLIDCGFQIGEALYKQNIPISKIDDIYISHLHADHIGYLEGMAFLRYDWKNHPRKWNECERYAPRLIGNKNLLKDLWEGSLQGGLKSMEGFDATIETYFEPMPIEPNQSFFWQGWEVNLIQQIHVMTGSVIMNTFGLIMSKKDHKTVYFTTDSQHCSPKQIEVFYEKADLIFQDCECVGVDTLNKKFVFSSGVHANYAQLAGYPSANSIKLSDKSKNKMWLSHYQDFVMDNKDFKNQPVNWYNLAMKDGFQGFVKVGQVFEI